MNRGYCMMEHWLIEMANYKEYLSDLHKKGIEGIVVNHVWNEGYLKDEEAWKRLNDIIDYAKELGMNVWLYDERGYPSGKAGRLVIESDPDYQAKGLTYLMRDRIAEGEKFDFKLPDDLEKIVYVYVERGGESFPIPFEERSIKFEDTRPHDSIHIFCERKIYEGSIAASSSTDEKYVNIMNKDAIKRFIEITYDAYGKNIPDFGGKIDAVFTDEPALAESYVYHEVAKDMWWSMGYKYATLSWCDGFEKEFEKDHGYNVLTCARRLFRGDDEESAVTRIHYRETVARLVSEAYFGQIQSWCERHGTQLSGHCNNEEYLHEHVMYYGNLYTTLDKMGYLGMDILNGCIEELMYNDRRFIGNKFVGSLARIRGKSDTVMVELCPHRDKAFVNFTQIKAVTSYLYFCGVNYTNSYWRAENEAQSVEFSNYLHFLYANLGERVKDGKIAVYYPIETVQALVKPLCVAHEDTYRSKNHLIGSLEESLRDLATDIWARGLDFEFLDAVALDTGSMKGKKFSIAGMEFSVLLMPGVKYLSEHTYLRVKALEKAGLTVVWLGNFDVLTLYGKEISYAGVKNRPYTELKALNKVKNLISWTSKDKFLYAEFTKDGEITGMFLNNDNEEKSIRFKRPEKITVARFNGEEAAGDCVKVAPYETIFVKKRI